MVDVVWSGVSHMKYWIARIVLTLGYALLAAGVGSIIFKFYGPIFTIVGSIIGVFMIWIAFIWFLHVFAWAHENWRKL
jgi:hypothetical protein